MARYSIQFKASVRKDLRKIPKKDVLRILAKIEALAEDPLPPQSEKLSGDEKYRIRQGNYRILYSIEDDILVVTVVKVGHRRDVYQS
ncbi:MAG: type II toxin-antitoxin system mRNA interferase toxin, RelE/StbE family [Zetaproteobacteria bacterium]|nr:MAG: type II toxin-antitoxin system mRNA interferase toxin, RelE/StbE family [Zetaproteobacteria bacterium]